MLKYRYPFKVKSLMLDNMINHKKIIRLNYDKLYHLIHEVVIGSNLSSYQFDAVICVLRGGMFPAAVIAQLLNIPIFFIGYKRKDRKVYWNSNKPQINNALLVEDIAGFGWTLHDCQNFLSNEEIPFKTFTISVDEMSRIRPDFFTIDTTGSKVLFPWEKHTISIDYKKSINDSGNTEKTQDNPSYKDITESHDFSGVMLSVQDLLLLPNDDFKTVLEISKDSHDRMFFIDFSTNISDFEENKNRLLPIIANMGFRYDFLTANQFDNDSIEVKNSIVDILGITKIISLSPKDSINYSSSHPLLNVILISKDHTTGLYNKHIVNAKRL